MDDATQQFLVYVARPHNRSTRLLLVVTQTLHYSPFDARFSTDLLRRPNLSRLQPQPLTPAEVLHALSRYPGLTGQDRVAAGLHRISEGNPLLLRALISEHTGVHSTASLRPTVVEPQPGGAFAQAVVSCLQSFGQHVLMLAAAMIVLDHLASTALLARLIGTTRTAVSQGMSALESSGLSGAGLGHPVVRTTVLDHLPPGTLAKLHRPAADITRAQGRAAPSIARHLLAAVSEGGTPDFPAWAADVLRSAAEDAVESGVEQAVPLLGLARHACADAAKRITIKTRLAALVWRLDPGAAEQHLTDAVQEARAGDVPVVKLLPLLRLLVAQGRMAEAAEVRQLVSSMPDDVTTDASDRAYRAAMHRDGTPADAEPDLLTTHWVPAGPTAPDGSGAAGLRDSHLFSVVGSNTADIIRFLQNTELTGATVPAVIQATLALSSSEKVQHSVHWCGVLQDKSRCFNMPGWQALFSSLRAQALLGLGDLPGAEQHSLAALEYLSSKRTSDFSYAVLATLLRARTSMGKYAEAAAIVEQPVPDTLHLTVHGPAYFRARTQYYLATRQFQAGADRPVPGGAADEEVGHRPADPAVAHGHRRSTAPARPGEPRRAAGAPAAVHGRLPPPLGARYVAAAARRHQRPQAAVAPAAPGRRRAAQVRRPGGAGQRARRSLRRAGRGRRSAGPRGQAEGPAPGRAVPGGGPCTSGSCAAARPSPSRRTAPAPPPRPPTRRRTRARR